MLTKVNNRSSHGLLSKQPQQVQSSKLVVVSLSCPELGTAQPQLVFCYCCGTNLLLLITLYVIVVNKCSSEDREGWT